MHKQKGFQDKQNRRSLNNCPLVQVLWLGRYKPNSHGQNSNRGEDDILKN